MIVPEPYWVIRGNKVRCRECATSFKTYLKYSNHWRKKHGSLDAQHGGLDIPPESL